MRTSLKVGLAAGFALSAAGPVHAEGNSPIFGHATFQPTTLSQNKDVVGKGYYADIYGYYGNYYSAYASLYGSQGFYFKNSSYYSYAGYYASYASTYYYYAAYYQAAGA